MGAREFPEARRVDHADVYHGTRVTDPYRWMEDLADPELGGWLEAEQALAAGLLGGSHERGRFQARLTQLLAVTRRETPRMRGGRWFQVLGRGEERSAIRVSETPDGPGRTVLERERAAAGELIMDVEPSPDGRLLLWSTSPGGSDWKTWHVTDVDSGRAADAEAGPAKLWAAWLPDGSGYLYIAFPAAGSGAGDDDRFRQTTVPQLRLRRLGSPAGSDPVVFDEPGSPRYFIPRFTSDGRYCVLSFPLSSAESEIKYAPADGGWKFTRLVGVPAHLFCIGGRAEEFLVATDYRAPNGRVVAISRENPDPAGWRDVVPEAEVPLRIAGRSAEAGDYVLAVRESLGRATVTAHRIDDGESHEIKVPGPASFEIFDISEPAAASEDGSAVCMTVSTPSSPAITLRHDLVAQHTETLSRAEASPGLDTESEVIWADSADGTRVPMTLVWRAGTGNRRDRPVIIEGYGGGGDSMEPYRFLPWKAAWLEYGGVIASAHLRGGFELGAQWQRAALRGGKLLAAQDFIACAEALGSRGVPQSRIAITGRSSGAMLAAAAVISRPDLFGACVAEVGLFDPLRYHLFGLGKLMIPEYGTSENPDDFRAMIAYSPLHRVEPGGHYPAFLVTVHTDDNRVPPGSAYKFVAALQAAQAGDAPVLLRLRCGAGHFGGTAAGEAQERADILAFLAMTLGAPLGSEASAGSAELPG